MSRAVSARYDVDCQTCGAQPHEPCRARRSGRVTDAHTTRIDAWHARHGLFARPPSTTTTPAPRLRVPEPDSEGGVS